MNENAILLVEDNPDDEVLTLRALKKDNIKNEVVVARDGAQALELLLGTVASSDRDARVVPQVVLLDLKVPKVDGLEVLRRIRADERTKRLPVVLLTSSNEEKDLVMCYDNGANSCIRKPVDISQFTEAVRELGLYWLVLNEAPAPEKDERMSKPIRILIVEDSEDDTPLLMRELRRGGYDPVDRRVGTPAALKDALENEMRDLITAEHSMPHFRSAAALKMLQEKGLDVPFIIVSGTIGEEAAVAAMRAGAQDYLIKANLKRFIPAVERDRNDAAQRRAIPFRRIRS